MSRVISLSVLLLLIALFGSMLYQVIAPFLLPLFLAAVLAVVCGPLNSYFLKLTGQRAAIAAAFTSICVVAIVVIPVVIGTVVCAMQLNALKDQHLNGDWRTGLDMLWSRALRPGLDHLKQYYPGDLSNEELARLKDQFGQNMQSMAGQIAGQTFQLASSTVGAFASYAVAAGMFITALYYFLADGPAIISAAEEMIPLPIDHQRRLRERFATVVRAVVTATFMAAFVQGFATAVAIQLCGIGYFWIFLAVATVASLIPLIGAWIVWAPCAILLAVQGHYLAATLLAIWGIAVVSMLDNIVKVYVLQNDADLHPLLAFISVVGALQVLGLWGIFIGPIVASCLFALVQIFNLELKELAKERRHEPPGPVDAMGKSVAEPVTSKLPEKSASISPQMPSPVKMIASKGKRRK